MANVGDCFVCGISLAQVGKARAEVVSNAGVGARRDFCMGCWWKVSEALMLYTVEDGISYVLEVKYWRAETADVEG